jgi:hypothetical protein
LEAFKNEIAENLKSEDELRKIAKWFKWKKKSYERLDQIWFKVLDIFKS